MLADLRRGKLATTHDAQLGWMIAVGTLPIIVCRPAVQGIKSKSTLRSLYVMSAALAGVAMLLAIAEWWVRRREAAGMEGRDVNDVGWARCDRRSAVAQAAALVPGTSRSGATILGGLAAASRAKRPRGSRSCFRSRRSSPPACFELIEAREAACWPARRTP